MKAEDVAKERCETCCFWAGEKMVPDEPYPVTGRCRRRAPIATGGMMSAAETIWPWTGLSEWCGEYRAPDNGEG